MSKITRINDQVSNPDKVNIFIDNSYCTSVRKRTFQAMNLKVGSEISCEELKEQENFFWKKAYANNGWKKEKIRLDRIKAIIENADARFQVNIVGFGADSEQIIKSHASEKGIPDLDVVLKSNPNEILMKVEVTGTEFKRGNDYWVRPDKIAYSESHPNENIWTALHYSQPQEEIRFLKHTKGKVYPQVVKQINGANEIYCIFTDDDDEIYTINDFLNELISMVK